MRARSKMHASFISMEQGKPRCEMDAVYLLLALVFLVLGAGSYLRVQWRKS